MKTIKRHKNLFILAVIVGVVTSLMIEWTRPDSLVAQYTGVTAPAWFATYGTELNTLVLNDGGNWSAWDTMSVSVATAGVFDDAANNELLDIDTGVAEIQMMIKIVAGITTTSSDSMQIKDDQGNIIGSWISDDADAITDLNTNEWCSAYNGAVRSVGESPYILQFIATDEVNLFWTDHASTVGTILVCYRYRTAPGQTGAVISDGDGS